VAGFIAAQRVEHGIPQATACRALGVSQAWFYKWAHGDPSPRRARRVQLAAAIGQLFAAHRGRYGSPRITADLCEAGWRVSENTVARIMRERHLVARPKRRRGTTRPGRGRWRAPDLIGRDFAADGLNQKWYGDGTELPTDEGRLYLASVLDMGSRRVVGFAIGEHHDADLAYGALAMAIAVRGGQVTDVIMHTDQGSEYTAHLFRDACTRLRIRQSMGRVGSALDNAVIESWHSTLTFELRALEHFATKAQARTRVAAWIDEYNRDRRHSGCHMLAPIDYELAMHNHRALQASGSMTTTPPNADSVAPSSPVSRPSPPGGPRPAWTPAAGDADQHPSGARRKKINKTRST
jgi:putative transposase